VALEITSTFAATYIFVSAEDKVTKEEYEIHIIEWPSYKGTKYQVLVDPVSVDGAIWKCWLGKIPTPNLDSAKKFWEVHYSTTQGIPDEFNQRNYTPNVVMDVIAEYRRVVGITKSEQVPPSRFERDPVI
jgi:hypothetical protein